MTVAVEAKAGAGAWEVMATVAAAGALMAKGGSGDSSDGGSVGLQCVRQLPGL